MSRPFLQLDEIVSLALMLLMLVALVAGQADATLRDTVQLQSARPIAAFEGEIGAAALKISIDVATDLRHFRGEDE